jgi:hypothetical protein
LSRNLGIENAIESPGQPFRKSLSIGDLASDDWLKTGLQGIWQNKVYGPSQFIFEKELQIHILIEGWMSQFGQNIHVAPVACGTVKDRPEQADTFHGKPCFDVLSVLFEKIENLIAF